MSGKNSALTSALRDYRDLPAISGRSFLPISLLGRLPVAMTPVAILTYVAASTGSLAAAGLATTAVAAGTAVGAPIVGVLADRFGQRSILIAAVLANTAALLVLALNPGLPVAARLSLCAVAGFSLPQVGGMSRARWIALTRTRLSAALAFEGTADEMSFVLGPALAGIFATAWSPQAALLAAAAVALLAAGAFAVHPTHRAPWLLRHNAVRTVAEYRSTLTTRQLIRALTLPIAGMAGMGVLFASTQTAVTAFCAAIGEPSSGGLLYALMAVGSASTASMMPIVPARIGARARWVVSSAGLLAGALAMIVAAGFGTIAVAGAVLFTGLWVGPLLITLNQIAAERVSRQQSASAMSFLSAGVVCGIAAGALLAGLTATAAGAPGALIVTLGASVILVLLPVLMSVAQRQEV